jgi:hypothetical protein
MTLRALRAEWADRMSTSDLLSQAFHDHGLTPLSAWLDRRARQREAEATYFDAGNTYSYLQRLLACEVDPAERARLLRAMAGCQYAISRAHTPAFGPDPNPDEGGRDVAESDRLSADLLYLLADVETCVAHGFTYESGAFPLGFGEAACEVTQRMATTRDLLARHAMLAQPDQ